MQKNKRLKANLSKVEEAFNIPIVADCKSFLEDLFNIVNL